MAGSKLPMLLTLLATLSLIPSAIALPASLPGAVPASLHPKRHLFEDTHKQASQAKRQASHTYPEAFAIPAASLLPSAWRSALQEAVSDGRIPDIPRSTVTASGNIHYPSGSDESAIGSWTNSKYLGPNDISEAPDGVWGVDFDDGPTDQSPPLYRYLESVNQSATHFLIGSNIVAYPDAFAELVEGDQQLAVHTWSHNLQTALTNEQILGELAWTMQVIYDQSGKIPNLWRPPQGDVDNRVRAIAEEVLGLQCVLWVADSNDWCLDDNFQSQCPADNHIGQSYDTILDYIHTHIEGPKSPGVILLEHEIRAPSVALFREYYPTLRDNGWTPEPIGNFDQAKAWYANGLNASTPTTAQTDMLVADQVSSTSTAESSSTGTSESGTATSQANPSSTGATGTSSSRTSSGTAASQSDTSSSSSGSLARYIPDRALYSVASVTLAVVFASAIL